LGEAEEVRPIRLNRLETASSYSTERIEYALSKKRIFIIEEGGNCRHVALDCLWECQPYLSKHPKRLCLDLHRI